MAQKNIFKNIIAENVSVSTITKHNVYFELDEAFIEAKNAMNIDKVQLAKIAARSKEVGKDFWYVFLNKPEQPVIDKIKKAGGNVGWFLDATD